jgi:protein TonB
MRHAVASLVLHAGLLAALYLLVEMRPALSDLDAESMAVEILSIDSFATNSTETIESESTETLVAAGAEPAPDAVVETAEVEPAETVAEPVVEAVEPVVEAVGPLLVARTVVPEAAEVAPEQVEPVEPPEKVAVVEDPAPKPKANSQKTVENPPEKKPREKKPAAPAGNGGKAEADSAARAASGGQGRANDGGSAAVSRFPGLVQVKVTRASRYPVKAKGVTGEVVVGFVVTADGGVRGVVVERSSGNALLDEAALAAVAKAAPFPPIPADAGRSSWAFSLPLAFRR